jgi:hypothetical protein
MKERTKEILRDLTGLLTIAFMFGTVVFLITMGIKTGVKNGDLRNACIAATSKLEDFRKNIKPKLCALPTKECIDIESKLMEAAIKTCRKAAR